MAQKEHTNHSKLTREYRWAIMTTECLVSSDSGHNAVGVAVGSATLLVGRDVGGGGSDGDERIH